MAIMGQYEYMIDRSHHRANKEGQVYVHILIAEQKLNRKLQPDEVVHHIDGNKQNNSPDNLMVFATKGAHSRFHLLGMRMELLLPLENGSYECLSFQRSCRICGSELSKGAEICLSCFREKQKNRIPSKTTILRTILVSHGNLTRSATRFNVSSTALKKWCKRYMLPIHSKDYTA